MNRPLIITVGIIVVLFMFGVWAFLFMFGAPTDTRDVFSNLGIVDTAERPEEINLSEKESVNVVLSLNGIPLQQLTVVPVAGFGVATTSSKTILRYVERGTGHIFEVNLNSGTQTQVSGTTIPRTIDATFSPDLSVVVLTTEEEGRKVLVGEIPENSETDLQRTLLPGDAQNISMHDNVDILFTRNNNEQTIGYTHKVATQIETQDFVINIPNLTIVWSDGHIYGYPKPTKYLEGFLYEIKNNTLTPIGPGAYGLLPFISGDVLAFSYANEGLDEYSSTLYEKETGVAKKIPTLAIPEKCVALNNNPIIWCGAEILSQNSDYVENWYKGIYSSNDSIWLINTVTQRATQIENPTQSVGRSIDITDMIIGPNIEKLFFINKTDSTLWMYTL